MTSTEIAQATALARCTFSPGSTAKRFVAWAADVATTDPKRGITAKRSAFLNRLAHSYRKQIGSCIATDCEKCQRITKIHCARRERARYPSAKADSMGFSWEQLQHDESIFVVSLCGRASYRTGGSERHSFREGNEIVPDSTFCWLPPTPQRGACRNLLKPFALDGVPFGQLHAPQTPEFLTSIEAMLWAFFERFRPDVPR